MSDQPPQIAMLSPSTVLAMAKALHKIAFILSPGHYHPVWESELPNTKGHFYDLIRFVEDAASKADADTNKP